MKTGISRCAFVLVLIALAVPGFHGCKKENQDSTLTLKIGVLLGLSGVGSQNAVETEAALEICLKDIKDYISSNDLDVAVELIYEDTQSDTVIAKNKIQSLINQGVKLIIGPYSSSEANAVKGIANSNDVLLVSHSAVSTSLAIPGDHLLRFVPSDTYQAEAMNAMMKHDSTEAMVALVRNDLWSKSLMVATGNLFTAQGGDILATITFEPGLTDLSIVANDAKAALATGTATYGAQRTGLYLISYGDGTNMLEELLFANLPTQHKFYGASAFAQNATLTAKPQVAAFAEGASFKCPVFGFDESASNIYDPIQTKIEANIGHKASIYALAAYDILWVTFLTVITQNPKVEFDAFKTHFVKTANAHFGATGRTELDENGDRKHVFYDFWSVKETQSNVYEWWLSAKYSTTTKIIQHYR